jgi:hypothetical protein
MLSPIETKPHAGRSEVLDCDDQMAEASTEPIQPPADDDIDAPPGRIGRRHMELRP